MPAIESLLSVIAPHDCLVCDREGALICSDCWLDAVPRVPSRCYRCYKMTKSFITCPSCRSASQLYCVLVRTDYDHAAKDLVRVLKFGRARAAAEVIASYVQEIIPDNNDLLVIPVPTATSRKRQRGYDQSELIAKALAHKNNLQYTAALHRQGQQRQLGLHRKERLEQLKKAFWANNSVKGQKILLVDDVLTTGGTLEAAAHALKSAGAKQVWAIVFAQA